MIGNLKFESSINNLGELQLFWEKLIPQLSPRCILLLEGEMGAGKTTSVQIITKILGLEGVQSPSFAIHLRYENNSGKSLDHLDFYRVNNSDEIESTGFWDLFYQKTGLVVIEWANRLDYDQLPLNWQKLRIHISKLSDNERRVQVFELTSGCI